MLDKAFKTIPNGTGLILHSDQGWQYQNKYYRQMLKQKGIRQSMSRKDYNNHRIKAKRKGLPPAIYRQQALLAS